MNTWMKSSNVPTYFQFMPKYKVISRIRMQKTTPSERLNHLQVLSTWKIKTQGANEKFLMKSLLKYTTNPIINNRCFEQQQPTIPMDQVEEDIQIHQVETTIEEENVDILAVKDQQQEQQRFPQQFLQCNIRRPLSCETFQSTVTLTLVQISSMDL